MISYFKSLFSNRAKYNALKFFTKYHEIKNHNFFSIKDHYISSSDFQRNDNPTPDIVSSYIGANIDK